MIGIQQKQKFLITVIYSTYMMKVTCLLPLVKLKHVPEDVPDQNMISSGMPELREREKKGES